MKKDKINFNDTEKKRMVRHYFTNKYCHGKCLDMGCGFKESKKANNFLEILYLNKNVEFVERIDIDPLIINNNWVKTIHGDCCNYERKNKYNTIICLEVIEHIESYKVRSLLMKSSSLLLKDGVVIFSTPHPKREFSCIAKNTIKYILRKVRGKSVDLNSIFVSDDRHFKERLIDLAHPSIGLINSSRVIVVVEAQAYSNRWNDSRSQNLRLKR